MRNSWPCAAFGLVCLALLGCDNSKAANANNFQKALQAYDDAHRVCLSLPLTFPTEIGPGAFEPMRPQLEALAQIGFLSMAIVLRPQPTFSGPGKMENHTRYDISSAGENALRKGADRFLGGTDLCFAHRKITKIDSFTVPADEMGVTVSRVTYDYVLDNIAPWTGDASMRQAFPGIATTLAHPTGTATEGVVLTIDGWKDEHDLH
jgi:hypothetical protein